MTSDAANSLSIWNVPALLSSLQPELTSAAIAAVEAKLGIGLPAALVAVLQEQNGGYLRRTLPDTGHRMIWGIGPRGNSIGDNYWWELLDHPGDWYPADGWLPQNPRRLVPFDSDGHWYLCLDYRNGGDREPRITWFDLDEQEERAVAKNMPAFLTMLTAQDETKLGWVITESLAECAARLDGIFEHPSEPRESDDLYGYPFFRWFREDGWVQLAPNRVKRGFISRQDEATYQELKDLLPGEALRFPEHPQAAMIIHCGNQAMTDSVQAALTQEGFDVRRLQAPSDPAEA